VFLVSTKKKTSTVPTSAAKLGESSGHPVAKPSAGGLVGYTIPLLKSTETTKTFSSTPADADKVSSPSALSTSNKVVTSDKLTPGSSEHVAEQSGTSSKGKQPRLVLKKADLVLRKGKNKRRSPSPTPSESGSSDEDETSESEEGSSEDSSSSSSDSDVPTESHYVARAERHLAELKRAEVAKTFLKKKKSPSASPVRRRKQKKGKASKKDKKDKKRQESTSPTRAFSGTPPPVKSTSHGKSLLNLSPKSVLRVLSNF
jgi:hypothetical protein